MNFNKLPKNRDDRHMRIDIIYICIETEKEGAAYKILFNDINRLCAVYAFM